MNNILISSANYKALMIVDIQKVDVLYIRKKLSLN